MFDSIQRHLILSNHVMFEILILALFLIVWYKLYRFWYCTNLILDLDHTIFNPKHLDVDSENSDNLCAKYPSVWYPLILSKDLKPGQVKPIYIFEKDLVVFRSISGKVHILDAYCAHQGAHLGVGGSVVGEDVQCPFHAWTFNGDGVCTSVPGLEGSNLPKAKINAWKSIEMNHWVFIWYHDQGAQPTYFPQELEYLKNAQFCGQTEFYLNCHIMDCYGNGVDLAHFDHIHTLGGIVSDDQVLKRGHIYNFVKKNIFRLDFRMEFDKDIFQSRSEKNNWPSTVSIAAPVFLGIRLDFMEVLARTTFCPTMVYLHMTSNWFKLNVYLSFAYVPVSRMRWHVFINLYHEKSSILNKIAVKFIMRFIFKSVTPEIIVLNNKKYFKRPYLTKLDELQAKFFKWFSENYYSK